MDILLNKDTKDLEFINGGCPVVQQVADVVAQRLTIRLRTLFSEWFLNTTYGVPYLQEILGHKVNKETVDMILQDQIYQESGVIEIVSFRSTLNNKTRKYECNFRVRTQQGVVDISVSPPINN